MNEIINGRLLKHKVLGIQVWSSSPVTETFLRLIFRWWGWIRLPPKSSSEKLMSSTVIITQEFSSSSSFKCHMSPGTGKFKASLHNQGNIKSSLPFSIQVWSHFPCPLLLIVKSNVLINEGLNCVPFNSGLLKIRSVMWISE